MTSIDHVDLNLLRVFQAIVDERSLTKAGERLALSQPAISYSLARLRTLFDDPLFIRTRSGMQPTPIALELASIVGRALDTVREALRYAESFDPATSTRTFRLSLSDAGEMAYLPAICEALHERAPRVKLSVEPLPVEEIEGLKRGLMSGMRAEPHRFLTAGRRVRVRSGPLAGTGGILVRRKSFERLVISLELIHRSIAVDLAAADIEAVPN